MLFTSNLIFLSLFSFADASSFESCVGNRTHAASHKLLSTMTLRLYKTSYEDYVEAPITEPSKLLCDIDNCKPTHFYTYGWVRFQDPKSIPTVINAYLFRKTCNIILLDWSKISNTLYGFAKRSVASVGCYWAKAIEKLHEAGLNVTGLTLIGHSLGGQIIGHAGRNMKFKLPRIIALDPAGPGFYVIEQSLSSFDADCVSVIHTDRNLLGINEQVGHQDFYPNDGSSPQPGCLTFDYCSHYRSVFYFAESVRNTHAFIGRPCTTYLGFKAGSCSPGPTEIMGYGSKCTACGKYFLQTNWEKPFGRGEQGATHQNVNNTTSSKVDGITSLAE